MIKEISKQEPEQKLQRIRQLEEDNLEEKTIEKMIKERSKQEPEQESEQEQTNEGDEGDQEGAGNVEGGLTDKEISEMMEHYDQFIGCYYIDEISRIKPPKGSFGFCVFIPWEKHNNEDNSEDEGDLGDEYEDEGDSGDEYENESEEYEIDDNQDSATDGHWVAIYIDPYKDRAIEYYDSFGKDAPLEVAKELKGLVEKINPSTYLKFKINRIKNQRANSDSCGWLCMNFLKERFNNKKFIDATGYSTIMKSEKDVKKMKQYVKKFGYI